MAITASSVLASNSLEDFRIEFNNLVTDVDAIQLANTFDTRIIFEGSTVDGFETALTLVDPTADRSIVLPNVSGNLIIDGNPISADGESLGTASLEWSDAFLADSAVIYFGNDQDVTLTHVHDTGLSLNLMMAATTFEPTGDTASGDNAAIGYTSVLGLILTGEGSTNDVTIVNDDDVTVMGVATGTTTVNFAGQVTGTGFTGTLDGILGSGAAAAATVTTLVTSGVVSVDDTTTSTSGTTGSIHTDGGLGVAGTAFVAGLLTVADDLVIKSGGTIGGAGDTDLLTLGSAILTVAGEVQMTTLDIGGTNVTSNATELNLVDGSSAGSIVNSKAVIYSSGGVVNATDMAVSGSGNRSISITSTDAIGSMEIGSAAGYGAFIDLKTPTSDDYDVRLASEADGAGGFIMVAGGTFSLLGSSETMATFADDGAVTLYHNNAVKLATAATGITMTGEVTATGFTGTLDGVLGGGAAAAATTTTLASTTITASGIIKTDDTTAATSTTDGSLQTDGGLSVVLDAVIGDDLIMISDAAAMHFGVNSEITLTHVHDVGLNLKHTATADDKPIILTLQTGETDMAANDVMGKLAFQAPDEGTGTDAVLVAAAIQARAEGDFSSSSNATSLDFMTGSSEAAATKMTLNSAGNVGIGTTAPTALRTRNLEVSSGGTNDGAALIANKRGTGIASMRLATVGAADGWDINYNHPTSKYLGIYDIENAAYRMVFDTSGNVGIGTAAPAAELNIKGAAPEIIIQDGATDTFTSGNVSSSLRFQARNSSVRDLAQIDAVHASTNGTVGAMRFQTRHGDTLAERLRITSAGLVGIGIAAPVGVLQTKISSGINLMINTVTSGFATINAINDDNTANVPLEIRSTSTSFSAGRVTMAAQPRFLVQLGSDQTNYVGVTSNTIVVFDNAVQNIGSHFNTSTGKFTAPVSGMYAFQASAITTGTAFTQGWLVINDGRASYTDFAVGSSGIVMGGITWIHFLSANDTVGYHPYVNNSSAQTVQASALHTWFKGYLIS
jgi:hypothetical protein